MKNLSVDQKVMIVYKGEKFKSCQESPQLAQVILQIAFYLLLDIKLKQVSMSMECVEDSPGACGMSFITQTPENVYMQPLAQVLQIRLSKYLSGQTEIKLSDISIICKELPKKSTNDENA